MIQTHLTVQFSNEVKKMPISYSSLLAKLAHCHTVPPKSTTKSKIFLNVLLETHLHVPKKPSRVLL